MSELELNWLIFNICKDVNRSMRVYSIEAAISVSYADPKFEF